MFLATIFLVVKKAIRVNAEKRQWKMFHKLTRGRMSAAEMTGNLDEITTIGNQIIIWKEALMRGGRAFEEKILWTDFFFI